MLMALFIVGAVLAPTALGATGNVDTLCQTVSSDLNTAGGCVDDSGLEDTVTSSAGLFVLEGGDSSSLIWLGVLGIFGIAVAGAILGFVVKGMTSAQKGFRK